MKVGFISLGCNKNLVVTECLIGMFKSHNYEIVNDENEADVIVINTCGFIDESKNEAIETILEMADYKNKNCKYLIVIGCLVTRYKKELIKELPEVDLFISIREYSKMWNMIDKLLNNGNENDELDYNKRFITTGNNMAYLKIAEGCSNCCAYCAIPMIQGKYVSRKYEDIIKEANDLANKGYKELVVIAQDTTKYGIDLYGKPRLSELLNDLCKIDKIKWVRFLYAYPESIDDELINTVKNNDKICNYFDIPIQHISDNVLKNMNRSTDSKTIKNLIKKLRKEIKDVVIRTTLIAGFPGETEEEFNELCDFVSEYKIDKLGCFAFSKENGTRASLMDNQIKSNIKNKRKNEIMKIQQKVSKEIMDSKIGKTYEVLLEDVTDDLEYFIGRSYMDVPESDGVIYVKYDENYGLNEFVDVVIEKSYEYDLIGKIIDDTDKKEN